jgi:hypothetical protein
MRDDADCDSDVDLAISLHRPYLNNVYLMSTNKAIAATTMKKRLIKVFFVFNETLFTSIFCSTFSGSFMLVSRIASQFSAGLMVYDTTS